MKYGEKKENWTGVSGPETTVEVSSLGFLFTSYILNLELEKLATWTRSKATAPQKALTTVSSLWQNNEERGSLARQIHFKLQDLYTSQTLHTRRKVARSYSANKSGSPDFCSRQTANSPAPSLPHAEASEKVKPELSPPLRGNEVP